MLDGCAVCAWRRPSLMSCCARHGRGRRGTLSPARLGTTSGRASDGRARQLVPGPLPTSVLSSGEGVGGHGAGDKVWTAALLVRACVGTSQGGPHCVAGLVPEQKGSRARRCRYPEVRCRYLDGRSQDLGAAHPPKTLGWAWRPCGTLLARRCGSPLRGCGRRLKQHTPRATSRGDVHERGIHPDRFLR